MSEQTRVDFEDGHAVFEHRCADDEWVVATLPNGPWTVTRVSDVVTVVPSVHCTRCGLHGWISDGQFWTTGGPR